jgi:acetylornithine/N-succinyldiaminopimelate aminotransferase
MLELAARLVALSCFDRVFLANTGAEANEGAVKLARRWGRRARGGAHGIVSFEHGFHGRTLAMMSASGKPGWDTLYAPMPAGFAKARLNDIASVERALAPDTVAVMIEFVQGEAGVVVADRGFVRELRALTAERQVLLIADEV